MVVIYSVISLLLTGVYLFLLSYLVIGWARLKRPATTLTSFKTKVTVLIAARDEEERIHYTIEDILAQDYPKHLIEVIIVDDHSTDNTANIIRSYAAQGVKLLQLKQDQALNSYKKKAISEAIALSEGELMIATDADCRMGTQWISSVVNCFETEQPVMISSPVTYFEEKSLFELLQTLEFSFLIGMGAGFIGNKRASHCNGANLAYRKDIFYAVGGFKGIDDVASGDDELLLQKVAKQYPGKIAFLKQYEAIVYTHAKHTLKEFMQQRRRWASKSTKYIDKKVTAASVAIWLFNITLLANAIAGFFNPYFFKLFLVQFLLKMAFEIMVVLPINKFFRRPWIVGYISILAFIHVIYFVYVGLMGNTRKYVWKGRLVK